MKSFQFLILIILSVIMFSCTKKTIKFVNNEEEGIKKYLQEDYAGSVDILTQSAKSGRGYSILGLSFIELQKNEAALRTFKKALAIMKERETDDSTYSVLADIHFGMGKCYDEKNNFKESYFHYRDAAASAKKANRSDLWAKICNNIGVLMGKLSWYNKSAEWFDLAAKAGTLNKDVYKRRALGSRDLFKRQKHEKLTVLPVKNSPELISLGHKLHSALNQTGRFELGEFDKSLKEITYIDNSDFDYVISKAKEIKDNDFILVFGINEKQLTYHAVSKNYDTDFGKENVTLEKEELIANQIIVHLLNLMFYLEN